MAWGIPEERRFFMIGVIHRDGDGARRLEEWLNRIGPGMITVELSAYGLQFRRERGAHLREKTMEMAEAMGIEDEGARRRIREDLLGLLDLPYEYETARQYGETHDARLYCVDMDFFSFLRLRKVDDLVSPDNVAAVACRQDGEKDNPEKALARLFFEKGVKVGGYTEEMHVRDCYVARRIGLLMRHHPGTRVVHVCGWRHLEDPFQVFRPLQPVKVFVYDETVRI